MTTTTLSETETRQLEESLDPEMSFRRTGATASLIVGAALLALSCFHTYTAGFGLLREDVHRGIHLAFVIGLIFLVFPRDRSTASTFRRSSLANPAGIPLYDWLLAAMAVVGALYIPWIFKDLASRVGNPLPIDVAMGTAMIVLLIEATRRAIGWGLPVIALCSIAYALLGPWIPGILLHPGASWSNLVNHLYLTSQGIYGTALGVVATYVFHFVLFGVLANKVGLGRLFLGVAAAVAGRFSGGPAKVSIFGSALFGMISGSSIANTVTVGSLTIPMMIRLGYQRHFAAAVESTAATGGQITPPIMGAAAFLMVEYLNLPYATIVVAAIIPALMHFFGVLVQVHYEAKKLGLRGMTDAEIPDLREVFRRDWPAIAPLVVLIAILFSDYTPYLAAFWGIVSCIALNIAGRRPPVAIALIALVGGGAVAGLLRETVTIAGLSIPANLILLVLISVIALRSGTSRERLRADIAELTDAFILGAKYAIGVGAAAATVGIIVGVVTLTGVGFKISWIVTSTADWAAHGVVTALPFLPYDIKSLTLLFTLITTAVVCILLGCGVPTTATYIIMVTVSAPALALLGVEPLVAHFFVFYYGVLADITPPVAIAAYAGASMAGADPFKTGNTAFRLAIGKGLVPFIFVFQPAMLLVAKGFTWAGLAQSLLACTLSIYALSLAFTGYWRTPMRGWERLLVVLAVWPLVSTTWIGIAFGLVILAPVAISQIERSKRGGADDSDASVSAPARGAE